MKSKMNFFTVLAIVAALLMMTVGAAGCAKKEEPVVLKLADAGWDSIQLHNSIVPTFSNMVMVCKPSR